MKFELKGKFLTHKHLLPAVTMGALGLRRPSFASISRADVFYDRVEYCLLLLDIGLEEIRPARKVNGIVNYNDTRYDLRDDNTKFFLIAHVMSL